MNNVDLGQYLNSITLLVGVSTMVIRSFRFESSIKTELRHLKEMCTLRHENLDVAIADVKENNKHGK